MRKLRGYIHKQFVSKKYMLIKGQDSQIYFAHINDAQVPHGHFCLFTPPAEVFFNKSDVPCGSRPPQAQNVRLVEPFEVLEKEISEVYLWKGSYGFASRENCNCELFIDVREVITLGEIEVGTLLYHSVAESRKPDGVKSWKASQIEICIPDPPPLKGLADYMVYQPQ